MLRSVTYYCSLSAIICMIILGDMSVTEGATSESHEQGIYISTVNSKQNVVELNKELTPWAKRLSRAVHSNEDHLMNLGPQSPNVRSINDYDEINHDMPERYSLLDHGKLLVPSEKLQRIHSSEEENEQPKKDLDSYDHKYRVVIDTLDPPEQGSTFGPFPNLPEITIDGEKIAMDKRLEYILKTPEKFETLNNNNNNNNDKKMKQRISSIKSAHKLSGHNHNKNLNPAKKKSKLRKQHSIDNSDAINPIPYFSYKKADDENLDEKIIEDIVNKILSKVHDTPEFEIFFGKSLPEKISLGSTGSESNGLKKNLQQFLKWVVDKSSEYRHESNLNKYSDKNRENSLEEK